MPTEFATREPIRTDELPDALIITRNLPPLVGGMERLVWHIVDELREGYRIHVIGPNGCGAQLPQGVTVTEVPLKPISLYLFRAIIAALREALHRRLHIVFAGSGLTAPFAWIVARLSGANCFVYLHGLDIEARHPLYRLLWRPFFRHFDRIMVNSRFTQQLASGAGIPPEHTTILHPGVQLPDMRDAIRKRIDFRNRHYLDDSPVMLYVGRITARKGLAVFADDILPRIVKQQPNAKLVVIGDEPTSALLQTKGERARIEEILMINGLKQSVRFLGELSQDDPELTAAYFASDVLVFPVQNRMNDNEGFGMVAIEAAAHGLPTVAFAVGGVTDAVADNISGKLVLAGDNYAFSRAVINQLNRASSNRMHDINEFAAGFAWPLFGQRLRQICQPGRKESICVKKHPKINAVHLGYLGERQDRCGLTRTADRSKN
ncbi:MAG: glycosyltransferase family 4 protein [Deltaproteobacteria bacterium]|nr:glycosyltransferase family 4 protein [Deltaproteobacteria bacterium]